MQPKARQISETLHLPLSAGHSPTPCEALNDRLAPPHTLEAVGSLDQYDLLDILGCGGMGIVYRALNTETNEKVAVKVLRPELLNLHPMMVQRFLHEARQLKLLSHPCIVPMLEIGGETSYPYFVMPMAPGGSLADRLHREGPLQENSAIPLARQIADAIAHAHKHGILHRDIKPENVVLCEAGKVWLTDFGLHRGFDSAALSEFQAGKLVGTLPYMSPAVASGEAEDTRADIYAFGALLYELLTGRPPYDGSTPEEVTIQIAAGPPPEISELRPDISSSLAMLVKRAMARQLRDRYASMADVVEDLDRLQSGEILTRPSPQSGPASRHLIALGLLVVILLTAAAAYQIKTTQRSASEMSLIPLEHMVWIPPGQFLMGSRPDEPGHCDNETLHEVSLSQGFYIGQFEVTQAEYEAVTGMNPSYWKSGTHPVERVTYQDALNYCTILSLKERDAGRLPVDWEYRLPTEAEWEYACRAESTGRFGTGIPEDLTTADANIGNTDGKTVAAGSYSPNAWGLYDMHGNVWEWVLDKTGSPEPYEQEAVTDPTGPKTGNGRRLRGGSWRYGKEFARSAYRNGDEPSRTYNDYGFRVVLARATPPVVSPEQLTDHQGVNLVPRATKRPYSPFLTPKTLPKEFAQVSSPRRHS